ncbi:MAG: hypothetical protein HFJ50_08865 [Clostridia bacterium]|jgi:hypothetical protein|nr:hypothetical protein [Clostridia bacterium]
MSTFEYNTSIRYTDITEENKLSNTGILNILSEAAGVHSKEVRLLHKQHRRNSVTHGYYYTGK